MGPNVVDAKAGQVPSSPHTSVVYVLEFDLSVFAFDPMESDEEDERDAGVPTVPMSGSWFPPFSVGVQHCGFPGG